MRAKLVDQPELRFAAPRLKLTQEFYAKYDRISRILDDNRAILELIHADLVAHEGASDAARFRYASDVVLRVSICQLVEGLSLRQTIVRIDTCEALRSFTRIESGKMIDYSTFCRLRNAMTKSFPAPCIFVNGSSRIMVRWLLSPVGSNCFVRFSSDLLSRGEVCDRTILRQPLHSMSDLPAESTARGRGCHSVRIPTVYPRSIEL